jgi:metal-responsive CopG/Arc/MetJ family transcriptional regulator
MKTAISIPDPLFEAAERFAQRLGLSRSELYTTALREYLQTHRENNITQQLDAVYTDECSTLDTNLIQLQSQSLPEEKW